MPIRPATLEDAERLAAIIAEVAPEGTLGAQAPVDVAERAERFRASITAPAPAQTLVLELDGQVVGYAEIRPTTPGVLSLAMAIAPEGRGRGGGRRLLETVLARAREGDSHKVDLEVWLDNPRAISLYVSAGFQVEGIRRDHYRRRDGRLRSSMIMARRLDEGAG